MLLFIDTSDHKGLHFAMIPPVQSGKPVKEFRRELAFNENFKTLELLQKFIRAGKVPLAKIDRIIVCSGPGSFTGIRVGIALAQAMGFALNIPVATIPQEKIPEDLMSLWKLKMSKKLTLNYGREPNITLPASENATIPRPKQRSAK